MNFRDSCLWYAAYHMPVYGITYYMQHIIWINRIWYTGLVKLYFWIRFEWRLMSHMLTLKLFGKYKNRQMLNQIEETRRTLDDINTKIHTLKCRLDLVKNVWNLVLVVEYVYRNGLLEDWRNSKNMGYHLMTVGPVEEKFNHGETKKGRKKLRVKHVRLSLTLHHILGTPWLEQIISIYCSEQWYREKSWILKFRWLWYRT